MTDPVLDVKGLKTYFFTDDGQVPAVDGIDFHVKEGEILGIVGESGCGKSVTSLSVMGLLPSPPGKVVDGKILYNGEDITYASESRMRQIRGNDIAMIFQEPMTSLNPVFTIGSQLIEAIRIHRKCSKKQARARAIDLLKLVGLPRADELVDEFPHQLSGGMRQRVMIAMAMACDPKVLIADEPTTALDVTIQAQILDLMLKLNRETKTAIIIITHDLGVVAQMCQRLVVMYAGKVVEEGTVKDIYNNPKHPYTKGLIQSVPDMREKKQRLYSIKGSVPKPGSIKKGCQFAPRCEYVMTDCLEQEPQLTGNEHLVRCLLYRE
ncbi:peptide/nickel transport system ATP-binding protein [Scopulibacillus darangshiensis]|uniref:Peptide/nickel transport system ATP-binding protein n=1 Tax=Scopulibacillus darangshiensis TaxID=442528 RepID=A0A4R2NRV4_9BACL|nr:ABC transporter ATP-binding protein [Scopulibacillus darangshiensis]TCP24557.1 peptide/nickel transport system ATP-binding protein [Scopulibacillus darangshiensis]